MIRRLGSEVTRRLYLSLTFPCSFFIFLLSKPTNWFRGFINASASMRGNGWFPFPYRTVRSASRCDSDSLLAVDCSATTFQVTEDFQKLGFWGSRKG